MIAMTVTNAGLNFFRDSLSGAQNPAITYIALGTGNATPTVGDTKLQAEVFRKQVSSYSDGSADGEVLIGGYIAPSEAVGVVIAEVGFFGGAAASSAPNSGVLIGRALYSHTKSAQESLQLTFDLTF